jgi:hypothetical protein
MGKRIDLDGLRFRMPGDDAVYLIDQGQKRHIADPFVYNALFRDWQNIHLDIDIASIDTGPAIDDSAFLFKCFDSAKVFLFDQGKKRHVATTAVMERFQFNWDQVQRYNSPLSSIGWPDGVELTKTGRPD